MAASLFIVALLLAACGGGKGTATAQGHGGQKIHGGTVYLAEAPGAGANYIFPLLSGAYFNNTNVFDLQELLYRPLYWYGVGSRPVINYHLSLADPPRFTNGDTEVTIQLKHYKWSNGEPVLARDVVFWMNLLKKEKDNWASYVPGSFPDNVTSYKAISPRTVVFHLTRGYDPTWFTYNELSQITPLPIAWDRTSLSQPAPSPTSANLPDATPAGAARVYNFLNGEAKKISAIAASPIWRVVDGPWRLQSISSSGEASFVPNRSYSGPGRPTISRLVDLPFTSDESEVNLLRAGSASGGKAGSQITVGYLPFQDLPQKGSFTTSGYRVLVKYPLQVFQFEGNFNNPAVGVIFRQLYFRQAFQHLIDQSAWIHEFYHGAAVPTYGPIPPVPPNSYTDSLERVNPYPFSVPAAKRILEDHGWSIRPGGTSTCARPGTGPTDCGSGIPLGKKLVFNLVSPAGYPAVDNSMQDLASDASKVGIRIHSSLTTLNQITATILPCEKSQASCSWQIGNYGEAWPYNPDFLPTGDEIYGTGALGNVGNYSSGTMDRLILATQVASSAQAEHRALVAYQNFARLAIPNFWQPDSGVVVTLQGNLRGYVFNPYSSITPEDWYFVKSRG